MAANPEEPRGENRTLAGDGREETPKERVDRNLEELTGELRVVITGVIAAGTCWTRAATPSCM